MLFHSTTPRDAANLAAATLHLWVMWASAVLEARPNKLMHRHTTVTDYNTYAQQLS